jgi:hypothetical protein
MSSETQTKNTWTSSYYITNGSSRVHGTFELEFSKEHKDVVVITLFYAPRSMYMAERSRKLEMTMVRNSEECYATCGYNRRTTIIISLRPKASSTAIYYTTRPYDVGVFNLSPEWIEQIKDNVPDTGALPPKVPQGPEGCCEIL